MTRILIADDERDLTWVLQRALEDAGFEVLVAHDGMEALALARRHLPDVAVLDIMMPRLDGLKVCDALKGDPRLAGVPVIFLTVRSAVEDRLAGFAIGADDYLVKPIDIRELVARIAAVLRRRQLASAAPLIPRTAGDLVVDPVTREVRRGRDLLPQLTPTEFTLLYHFASHIGRVFSAAELLQEVWGYPADYMTLSVVRWYVKRLREKIERDPRHPEYLHSVRRHGYVLRPPSA